MLEELVHKRLRGCRVENAGLLAVVGQPERFFGVVLYTSTTQSSELLFNILNFEVSAEASTCREAL